MLKLNNYRFQVYIWVMLSSLGLRAQTPEMAKFKLLERLQAIPAQVAQGNFQAALPELNTILPELGPLVQEDSGLKMMWAQGFYLQGICNLELSNHKEAVGSFNKFLTQLPAHPNNIQARLMLGEAHLNLEEWPEIVRVIDPLLRANIMPAPERETAFQLMSLAYTNLEKWEEALPYLGWLFKNATKPESRRDAASRLAVCHIRLGQYEELYRQVPMLSISQANYDINMNLLLLEEGDRFLNDARPDLALLMYRMVLPYSRLKDRLNKRLMVLQVEMNEVERLPVKNDGVRQQYRQLQWEKEQLDIAARDLEAYPDYDMELRIRLGDVYHELERWEESIQVYLSVYELMPESEIAERAMFAAFLTAFRAEEPVRAWEIAQRYMEKYPGGEYWQDVTLHAASLLVNLERWFEAVDVVDKALARTPEHVTLDNMLYIKAYAQFQQSLIRESMATMNTLLRKFPRSTFSQNAAYWVALGHLFLEEYAEARDAFNAIVTRNQGGPVQEDANYRQGVACYGLGDYPAATQIFTDFLGKYPDSQLASEALSMIGDMLAADSDLDLAIGHYQRAVEKAVNMVQADYATFQQARTLELEKRWQEILVLFESYLDQFPERANFTEATYWRGNALRQLGRQEEALQIFFDAIATYGNDPEAFGIDFILRDLAEELQSFNSNSPLSLNLRERLQNEMTRAADANERSLLMRLQILQRKKLTADHLMPELLQKLAARDIDGALNICGQTPCLFTSILEGGLARITTDEILPANIRMGIDETGEAKVATLIKPVNYLTNIASVSPMVGLLGTVSGMIKAFQGLSLGAGANAEQMAANISEALVTTTAGLVIAIPAMIFYFYFKNNFAQTLSSINAEIGRLLNALETGAVMYVPGDNEAYNSQHMNTQQLNVEG
jgi:biopolymer transport protein ExbB/TolQ/TolA-binding protein